jgi:AcrR family transcriptional regulator
VSQRHTDDGPLLDAARACVLAVGVRRTTLTDIARRAGVSRMTVYRRFPDVAGLLQALMTREFSSLLDEVPASVNGDRTGRARYVAAVLDGTQRLAANPLFRRILDVDPELMLPYVVQRYGAFQRLLLGTLAAQLRDGIADGSIRDADPEVLAAATEMALRGFVFSALAEDQSGRRAAVLAELGEMLDRGLAP